MKKIGRPALAAFFALGLAHCGDDDESSAHPSITSLTVSPTSIAAGGDVTVTVEAQDVTDEHFHLYIDDLQTNPLAQPHDTSFTVTIPLGTPAGMHTLIVRLHNHHHEIVEPQVTREVALEVL